jgi:hypothetical protein
MSESHLRIIKRLLSWCFYVILITLKLIDFQSLFNEERFFIKGDPFDGAQGFGVNQAERPARQDGEWDATLGKL